MRLVSIVLALALVGCAHPTAQDFGVPPPPAAANIASLCLKVKAYTDAQYQALASAIEALPVGSPIIDAFADYARMRKESVACATTAK